MTLHVPKTYKGLCQFDTRQVRLARHDPIQAICNLRWMLSELWNRLSVQTIALQVIGKHRRKNAKRRRKAIEQTRAAIRNAQAALRDSRCAHDFTARALEDALAALQRHDEVSGI